MKYLLNVFYCVSVLVLSANCAMLPVYPNLKDYKFTPTLGECYVMYDESEIMSPFYCQRPANFERQACIEIVAGEKECLGLKTPRNETIEFLCKDTKEEILSDDRGVSSTTWDPTTCFRVYSTNNTFEIVCQEIFENEVVGIRTPSNCIILFIAKRCPTSTSADERKAFNNFVNNFSFDSGIRSCFKVYSPDQVISTHTCLNKDIQESCIEFAYKGCVRIITPNNETVILDCPQGKQISNSRNCFKIYTADNMEYTACQKRVEERCVGITTPTNLTVLLECYYCYVITDPTYLLNYYDPEDQRHYRKLVKTYIDNEYLGKNSYVDKIEFEVFRKDEFVVPPDCYERRPRFYAYWLPNTTCYGITLENNETVILECTSYRKQNIPGCFKVVNSEMGQNNTVCIRVLDERCVGITTPQNLTIALTCYPEYNCYEGAHKTFKETQYAQSKAESYQFRPMLNACYEIYNSTQDVPDGYSCLKKSHPEKYSCIDWIPGQKHCLGLKIAKNEVIEFACGDSVEEVLSPKFPIKNCFHIYDSNKNVTDVCQKKIGNFSIGITSPNNLSILFDSFFCSTNKDIAKIEEYKEFVENFRLDPNMKSCYKVYDPHQDINPYTCFSREAYDACITVLDNKECMGISTHNNEIIVLNCANNTGRINESGCYEIYTADNKVHIACQEKLEESCVGITTPSKLRVLFDCHTCMLRGGHTYSDYSRFYQKNIKNSLESFKKGNYTIKRKYHVYKPDDHIEITDFCYLHSGYYDVRVLRGHNNCLGITMDNLETIVLECPHEKPEKLGCFEVYSPAYGENNKITGPEQKIQEVCIKTLEGECVGIITPGNRSVPLDCAYPLRCAAPIGFYNPNNKPPLRI